MAVSYTFRFGRCTSPTFGAVTLDMIDLPHVQMNFTASDVNIGGSTRSLDGTKRMDRFGLKREWPALQVGVVRSVPVWAPVKRMWKAGGPWLFFDQSAENLLGGDARLMQNGSWTNAAGAPLTPRLDGAISLAAGAVAQQGPTVSPASSLLTPVVAGTQYFAGCTVRGTGWTTTVTVAWFTATGPLTTASSAGVTAATALSTCRVLDGSVMGSRVGFSATAPAGAVFAQVRIAVAAAAADVSDPVLVPGPSDPGNAMTVVLINTLGEQHNIATIAGLTMDLSEV